MNFEITVRRSTFGIPPVTKICRGCVCTLTAVDSVIIVVDCVKGVEEQTSDEVCRIEKRR
jgi:hypothetical protein